MKANIKLDDWQQFIAPNTIPQLSEIPRDLDSVDSCDDDYVYGKEKMRRIYEALCIRFLA
jgi:hypothetical protein